MRLRALLVEDDDTTRMAVEVALRREGFEVTAAVDGRELTRHLTEVRPDVVILDVRLPDGPDGYASAAMVRSLTDIPVVFISAAGDVDARLAGFASGGEDYVVKPFSMADLIARVQVLVHRARTRTTAELRVGDLVLDPDGHTATLAGASLRLTRTEFEVLRMLGANSPKVVSKQRLLTEVWGFDGYDPNVVEVHISALRRKLGTEGARLIHTVRGVGYSLHP